MVSNPLLEEAREVYAKRSEFFRLHAAYLIASAVFLVLVWPNRGYMFFFRTESVPAVFLSVSVFQTLVLAGLNLFIGLDRIAGTQIIRYSEWLERTALPVPVLGTGKLLAAGFHTLFLTLLSLPFLVVAAGPAGVPIPVVFSLVPLVVLTAFSCRVAGMIVSHVGEESYVVRTIGGWLFLVLLFLVTISVFEPLNPIVAVSRQLDALEPGVAAGINSTSSGFVTSIVALTSLSLLLGVIYWTGLVRHRNRALRGDR